MNIGDEIISKGGHKAYITRIDKSGVDAISSFNGAMLSIRAYMIGNTWNPTGEHNHHIAKIVEDIKCNTRREKS